MSKKAGRPSVEQLLVGHYGNKKEMCKNLREIAEKSTQENDGRISFANISQAVCKETGLTFGPVVFRNMLRSQSVKNIPKGSVLGQSLRIGRGAPKGTGNGIARNPYGRAGKPKAQESVETTETVETPEVVAV